MAEEFLEEIYRDANLVTELKDIAELSIYQDGHNIMLKLKKIEKDVILLCHEYAKYNEKKATYLWNNLMKLKEIKVNIVVAGDIINKKIIPLLEDYINIKGRLSVKNTEEDYLFESTDSGFLTLKDIKKNFYFHSTSDPMWEAKKMVEYVFNPRKSEYAIWGCGLGYFAYQLYVISKGSVKINIFEPDARMIDYARDYGVLDWISKENLNIVIDNDILPFLHCAQRESTGMYIFRPELEYVVEDVQHVFEKLYTEYTTGNKFKRNNEINYWRNRESNAKPISQFDVSNYNKEYIVVAAGPSLDENMDFLRNNKGKKTIIAVGTVFRKLMENHIEPDMVVVLDSQERTYKQIEGLEEEKVPMLIAISAYWKFAAYYQGDKYLIPMAHLSDVRDYAIEYKEDLWPCGGTVTFLAMEAAIRFGAEKIYLVGVDLAYPDGVSHATGTMDRCIKNVENMMSVEGVNGGKVYTDRSFTIYREWIEKRIKETKHIKYYNISKVGAKIKGARKWQES